MSHKWNSWERFASSVLWMALCAQSSSASLFEDYSKIDIKFSFKNLIIDKWIVHLSCQVKTWNSYLEIQDWIVKFKWIDKETIQYLNNTFSILCVIPDNFEGKIYWVWFDNRTKISTPIKVHINQFVDPSLWYELSRAYIYYQFQKSYSIFNLKKDNIDHATAKILYKEIKNKNIENKLFWKINITRFAWRHKTRKSKTVKYREGSLRLLPYLEEFLKRIPDRYYTQDTEIIIEGKITKRINYIICWYNSWIKEPFTWKSYNFLIRLKEEIIYPSDWKDKPLSTLSISRTCTLASWWMKEEK